MLLFKIGGEAYGSVRAGHARPLQGETEGKVGDSGRVAGWRWVRLVV